MDWSGIKSAISYERIRAGKEHNEEAELEELAVHLQKALNEVIQRQVELKMIRENDSPDVMTCCQKCGGMMETPPRGGTYKCTPCLMALATGTRS